jgi:PAS domain-containing protein
MSTGNSKPELEAERKLSSSIPACEPPFLPHEAEDKLRHSEAAQRELAERQKAILNALPAQIALIDAQGLIISVNENWRRFAQEITFRFAMAHGVKARKKQETLRSG